MNVLIEVTFEAEVNKTKEILAVGAANGWTNHVLPGSEQGRCLVTWSAKRLAPHEAEYMLQEATRLHRNNFEKEKM